MTKYILTENEIKHIVKEPNHTKFFEMFFKEVTNIKNK